MVKKSFNPFKMWGAWVGAFLILLIPLPCSGFICSGFTTIGEFLIRGIVKGNIIGIIVLLFLMIFGFLSGWGIHSLVRALRK